MTFTRETIATFEVGHGRFDSPRTLRCLLLEVMLTRSEDLK